jgi:hypothetical protein
MDLLDSKAPSTPWPLGDSSSLVIDEVSLKEKTERIRNFCKKEVDQPVQLLVFAEERADSLFLLAFLRGGGSLDSRLERSGEGDHFNYQPVISRSHNLVTVARSPVASVDFSWVSVGPGCLSYMASQPGPTARFCLPTEGSEGEGVHQHWHGQ